jgi:hypothetical protein
MADTKIKQIAGHDFTIAQPYAEGHTVSALEAKVLNQVRAENIGNSMRKRVQEMLEAGDAAGAEAAVAEYDASYQFSAAGAGGRSTDPVEKAAKSLATEAVKAKIRQAGMKLSDVDKEKFANMVATVAERDDIQKLARKQVADQQKLAESGLEGIDLS